MKKKFKVIRSMIMYPFRILSLNNAIDKAEELYNKHQERFYVMPIGRRLIVVNRSQFRQIKRNNFIDNKATTIDALRESFYFTPDKGGNSPMNKAILKKKKIMYIKYLDNL